MAKWFYTPRDRRVILAFAAFLIFAEPLFIAAYYGWMYEAGAYPVGGDAVAIPIYKESVFWAILLPLQILAAYWMLSPYPGSIPLFSWNAHRPVWSGIWSVLFGLLVIDLVMPILDEWHWKNLPALLHDLLWTLFYFQLRALVVMKRSHAGRNSLPTAV